MFKNVAKLNNFFLLTIKNRVKIKKIENLIFYILLIEYSLKLHKKSELQINNKLWILVKFTIKPLNQ